MKNKSEKNKIIISRTMKWNILIFSFILLLIVSAIIGVISNNNKSVQVSTGDNLDFNNMEQEDDEVVNLDTLQSVTDKTEEELKELNDKEVEEAKKKEENKDKTNTSTTNNKVNKTTNQNTVATPKNKYYIKVNYGAQVVNVYTYDKNGNYTVPVKAFVCSTGTETPRSGVYRIPAKITWCYMFGNVYAHYCTQIVGNILFHSVPYLKKSNDTLEWWAYDQLGTKASMGCIRLTTRDAKWIFDNVSVGTKVEFYSSSNPGPLGKPVAQKISNAPANIRNWDPTDPDPRNPWRTYKPETNKNEQTNNTTNSENKVNNVIINQTNVNNQTVNNISENVVNTQKENTISNNTTTENVVNTQKGNTISNGTTTENVVNTQKENTISNNTTTENIVNNQKENTINNNTTGNIVNNQKENTINNTTENNVSNQKENTVNNTENLVNNTNNNTQTQNSENNEQVNSNNNTTQNNTENKNVDVSKNEQTNTQNNISSNAQNEI